MIRFVDLVNNIGANVVWWVRAQSIWPSQMNHIRVVGNSVRLGPLSQQPNYRAFCNSASGTVSDPSLIVGRPYTNTLATFMSLGAINDVTFDTNWISTLPNAQFFSPSPGDPGKSGGAYTPRQTR